MRTSIAPALLFLLVLFAGVFLRAYDWVAIPFTHDEFSALFRTGYQDFSQLIQEAVRPDGHPAGVQVFLSYWIALFGDEAYIVKLPFLALGLSAIYLTYRLGVFWYHETAGLMAAALVASTQPMVMYSQIAQPYMSGVFLVLLAVWSLSLYLNRSDDAWGPYLGWILAALGAAYNHYFSLLTVGVVGLLGLTAIPRERIRGYWLSGLFILAGFAPHIPITLTHLEREGLSWLGAPEVTFFWDFLRYLTHYNSAMLVLWMGLLAGGLVFHFRYRQEPLDGRKRFRYLLFGAFGVPALVGYVYSLLAEPVLQFSSLLFGLPLLFIAGCSLLPSLSITVQSILIALLLGLNSYTLIAERQHYKLLYDNRYAETKRMLEQDLQQYGRDQLLPLIALDSRLQNRWQKQSASLESIDLGRLSAYSHNSLNNRLNSSSKPYLAFAGPDQMNWEKLWLAQQHYPYLLKRKDFHLGQYYLMARKPHPDTMLLYTHVIRHQPSEANTDPAYSPAGEQFGPYFNTSLDTLLSNPNDVILASAQIRHRDSSSEAELALSLHGPGVDTALRWRSSRPMTLEGRDTTWRPAVVTIQLAGRNFDPRHLTAKAGVWDPRKKGFAVKDLRLHIIRGNRYTYGLRSPVVEPY
jgi:hypothetical protein